MKGKRGLYLNICRLFLVISLPVAIFLTILQYYSLNKDFYLGEYEKYNISNVTGMSIEDLDRVTDKLISYLKDEEKDLNIKARIDGNNEEVLGAKEKEHMIDVKNLFKAGYVVKTVCMVISFISVLSVLILSQERKRDLLKSILWSGIIPLFFVAALAVLVNIDFHKYFTYFHKIFFTNDLWLLNPNTDILIQMLPLEFFYDITARILIWFITISSGLTFTSYIGLKRIQ